MSKKLTNKKTYAGLKIITSNEDNDYLLCEDSLSDILHSLRHARDKLKRPLAVRYTIGLNNDHSFDINKLTRKVRESFRHTGYSLIYSFEMKSSGVNVNPNEIEIEYFDGDLIPCDSKALKTTVSMFS